MRNGAEMKPLPLVCLPFAGVGASIFRTNVMKSGSGGNSNDLGGQTVTVAAATSGCARLPDQAALDFATWVAIASIRAGDRQS